jgi:hypothetical protein
MCIPVKVNVDSSGSRTGVPGGDEQPSERSDAGVMIVPEVIGFVNADLSEGGLRSFWLDATSLNY